MRGASGIVCGGGLGRAFLKRGGVEEEEEVGPKDGVRECGQRSAEKRANLKRFMCGGRSSGGAG